MTNNNYLKAGIVLVGILALLALVLSLSNTNNSTGNVVMNNNMMQMRDHSGHMITSEKQFIFEMIPHHQEAVDTAKITNEKTENERVKALTQRIIDTQTMEIQMLEDWKEEFYPESEYQERYVPMMPKLERLREPDLDESFLEGMIMHHHMAIMMAQQVLNLNPNPEVANFARNVITVQSAEIEEMQEILNQDY